MKKSLYMTTALVAAGFMTVGVSGAMAAEKIKPVKLEISGFMKTLVGYSDQSGSYVNTATSTTRTGYDGFNQTTDSEIYFTGSTKLDNGIAISVNVQLETDQVDATIIDHSYMALSGNFGTLRLGSSFPVTFLMAKGSPNTGAIGITNGDTNNWIEDPATIVGVNVSTTNGANDAMKVAYMTPSFSGFMLGVNYTASETNASTMPAVGGNAGTDEQSYAGMINYTTKFNSATIGADMGYWETHGNASASSRNHRMGMNIAFGPWTVGASRKETKDVDQTSDTMAHDTYDAGLRWTGGDWQIGIQMVNSSSNQTALVSGDDEVTKYSVGAIYNMGPGVDLVGTIAHVNWEDELQNTDANNNSGVAAVGGISVAF